jgi:hypothetical protein
VKWPELKSMFYSIVGDSESSPTWFPAASILEWANWAVRDLCDVSNCLEKRTQIVVTAGTAVYDLPDDVHEVRRVAFDGEKLWPVSQVQLYMTDPRWRQISNTNKPCMYYLDSLNQQIALYPTPSVSTTEAAFEYSGSRYGVVVDGDTAGREGGYGVVVDISDASPLGDSRYGGIVDVLGENGLEIIYRARPNDITATGDIQIPAWSKHAILWAMLSKAYEAETQLQDVARSKRYRSLYSYWKNRLLIRSKGKSPRRHFKQGVLDSARLIEIDRRPDLATDPNS